MKDKHFQGEKKKKETLREIVNSLSTIQNILQDIFLKAENIIPGKKQEIQEEMKIIKIVKYIIVIGDKHINT